MPLHFNHLLTLNPFAALAPLTPHAPHFPVFLRLTPPIVQMAMLAAGERLTIKWIGPPQAQKRHRFNGRGRGHVYDPSASAKAAARLHANEVVGLAHAIPAIPVGSPCIVDLMVRYPGPASGANLPLAHADVDNLAKFYLDAVNGGSHPLLCVFPTRPPDPPLHFFQAASHFLMVDFEIELATPPPHLSLPLSLIPLISIPVSRTCLSPSISLPPSPIGAPLGIPTSPCCVSVPPISHLPSPIAIYAVCLSLSPIGVPISHRCRHPPTPAPLRLAPANPTPPRVVPHAPFPSCGAGVAYQDDRQVVELRVRKAYGGGADGEVVMAVSVAGTAAPVAAPPAAAPPPQLADGDGDIVMAVSGAGPAAAAAAATDPEVIDLCEDPEVIDLCEDIFEDARGELPASPVTVTISYSCVQCSLPHCGREVLAAPYECQHQFCGSCCSQLGPTCPICRARCTPGW